MSKRSSGFAAAFPWSGRQRFFESGEMRLAILSMLTEGPKHGYQLMKEMEHRSGGMYRASAGSTYPTLQQLEADGMVEAEMQSGRRVYRLTKAGRKEVTGDRIGVKRIWDRAAACEDWGEAIGPDTVGLWGPIGLLVKESMKAAVRVGNDRVREILERARLEMEDL